MPIDYDKIVEGRRRNWESLKPEEIRDKEREAKRESAKKEREEKGKEGFFARRQRLRDESIAADRHRFKIAMRQTLVLLGGFLLIAGGWVGVSHLIKKQREAALQRSLVKVQALVENGTIVLDMTTPVQTFGTWRSAWKRGDVPTIVKLFSPRFVSKTSESKSAGDMVRDYERLYRDGRLEPSRQLSLHFVSAQTIRIPKPPYRNEELAIFKSAPVEKFGERGMGMQYIVAFSYSKTDQNWHFADVREAKYFSVKWYMEAMIRPMRVGPGATTYTDAGDPIQTPSKARIRQDARTKPAGRPAPVTLK